MVLPAGHQAAPQPADTREGSLDSPHKLLKAFARFGAVKRTNVPETFEVSPLVFAGYLVGLLVFAGNLPHVPPRILFEAKVSFCARTFQGDSQRVYKYVAIC